ncbi:MAG: ROK family protein [Opitutales bacterium]
MTAARLVGIEIGGTKLQLVRGDGAGHIHERQRFAVDRQDAAEGIRGHIAQCLAEFLNTGPIDAVGVGFGGPFDRACGQVAASYHIEGWHGFALRDWLYERARCPVEIDNDANVAALAEAQLGAARGYNPSFYVTLGSGVGGGLIVDGRRYHGGGPTECEIGHLRLDAHGTIVEERCSGWSLDRLVREAVEQTGTAESGPLARAVRVQNTPGHEARLLRPALNAGDPLAAQLLDAHAENLALALSHVVQLLAPQCIVLGGGVSLIGEPLRARVAQALRPRQMDVFGAGPVVALAATGEDAVPLGALLLANEARQATPA